MDPEEEKQDEPKPVPEDEPAPQQLQPALEEKTVHANQLGQFNDEFELSAEVERKLTLEEETDQFELKLSKNTVEENAFTSEVKFVVGDLTQETPEFEDLTKPQVEELQEFVAEEKPLFEDKHSLVEETQAEQPKERSEGKQVPSNLDLEVI